MNPVLWAERVAILVTCAWASIWMLCSLVRWMLRPRQPHHVRSLPKHYRLMNADEFPYDWRKERAA